MKRNMLARGNATKIPIAILLSKMEDFVASYITNQSTY